MPKENADKVKKNSAKKELFSLKKETKASPDLHLSGRSGRVICDTDRRGFSLPRGSSPLEIVLDATEGFVPLWARDTTLRWRFRPGTLDSFQQPAGVRKEVERLLGKAIFEWGDAAPVRFKLHEDAWDFEIVVRANPDCTPFGCVLASAFFPDSGRHKLEIYPTMFEQSEQEQVETLIHEIGHIFGLRHFFANVSETAWASQIFGVHDKFTIMNYGKDSILTDHDRNDLRRLYTGAWNGEITHVNGTPIRLVQPYHKVGQPNDLFAIREIRTVIPQPLAFAQSA